MYKVSSEGKRAATTEATRRAVVGAARELLAERQWPKFTVEAVAKRAGVTRVTVYNQVGSKRGLLDAVLTDLTERARMDHLLTDTEHLTPGAARQAIIVRTCHFWYGERCLLRILFGLAALDAEVAALLEQREQWRAAQLERLVRRLGTPPALAVPDALAGVLTVTSFPAYDGLGDLAADPDRAAQLVDRLVAALTGSR